MTEISIIEQQRKANKAVKDLRRNKLTNGQPFMINSMALPHGQCYIEYPDGHICLASISSTKRDFVILRNLSDVEVSNLRNEFELY
jgi:hypothetical protein